MLAECLKDGSTPVRLAAERCALHSFQLVKGMHFLLSISLVCILITFYISYGSRGWLFYIYARVFQKYNFCFRSTFNTISSSRCRKCTICAEVYHRLRCQENIKAPGIQVKCHVDFTFIGSCWIFYCGVIFSCLSQSDSQYTYNICMLLEQLFCLCLASSYACQSTMVVTSCMVLYPENGIESDS